MSNRTLQRAGRAGVAMAVGCAFAAVPVAAQAAPVLLGTASPFVVLAGSAATNTGPSVLNGELGVSPGTAITGFEIPAVVNGAVHDSDAVALNAQNDLTTAYNVAAQEPATTLTGDLGNRTLTPGAYEYGSAALLTGPLTLNAQGNPNARFLFKVGSQLTTATASSVVLINGASPCNVFWQVGSSATLGSTTAFKGNLMALTSISLGNAATVQGRLLARNGAVTLINNVIDGSMCGTSTSAPSPTPTGTSPGTTGGTGGTGGSGGSGGTATPPASQNGTMTRNGTAILRRPPATSSARRPPAQACTAGFHATVRGHLIRRVVFSMDGKRIGTRTKPAFRVYVKASGGMHTIKARVGFKDATHSKTLKFRYRACAAQVLQPRRGPSQFTG